MLTLLKFVGLLLITSHWLACAWVLIGRAGGSDDAQPSNEQGGASSSSFFRRSWLIEAGLSEATPAETYGVAIFLAYASITSSSSGSISPVSPLEFYLLTAANVFGSAVWAYVISSACGIIATLNPTALHYRHLMCAVASLWPASIPQPPGNHWYPCRALLPLVDSHRP